LALPFFFLVFLQISHAGTALIPEPFSFPLASPSIWNRPQGPLTVTPQSDPVSLNIEAGPSGFLYSRREVLPDRLSAYSHLQLTLESRQAKPAVVELQFLEPGGKAKFWRKVDLPANTETKVDLPLRFMRPGSGPQPNWSRIQYLGFFFRDGFTGTMTDLRLVSKDGQQAWMQPEHLRDLGFDGTGDLAVRENRLAVITDVKELDAETLADHLMEVDKTLRNMLPYLKHPPALPTLLVFKDEEGYRGFHRKYGKRLNAKIVPPSSDGYALFGIATSSAGDPPDTFRPVFVHEFVHAHLDKVAGIPSEKGDWFQEGMATSMQLRFHPQDTFHEIVQDSLTKRSHWMPLQQLCDGRRIPMNRYWQAATLIELLSEDPRYAPSFPKLVQAMSASGSTQLEQYWELLPVSDWHALQNDWKRFCKKRYQN